MEEKERYFGSVRFFRHLILLFLALMIAIPTMLSIILGIKYTELEKKYIELAAERDKILQELITVLTAEEEIVEVEEIEEVQAPAPKEPGWELFLVNDSNPLPSGYQFELVNGVDGQQVDKRILEPLKEMLSAMRTAGLRPVVCSGYRSIERQSELFYNYIVERVEEGWSYEDAFYKAKTRIAAPGTSEHQTGLAVDIVGRNHQMLDSNQAQTKEAKWLVEHCAEYGFILRFPEGKETITGVEYESWHFRYVGKEAAGYIMENEITLEEYLELFY